MDNDKQRQEVSLIGRLFSMEALLLLMGLVSLVYGLVQNVMINVFWGLVIIPGVFILSKVRKKDWKKHWEELEAEQKARQRRQDAKRPPHE
ncbi:hypothetical protein [Geobacter sp. SVR]|uniref:hypothetical protein n=1 Tax=Geobacter sp. SVR TaxID=2495594 RepID=UPI00143EF4AF|nr:hypothetical protein [Geobacter sp. SVR]BCS52334.1 hypothetical protein GSVR_06420 [Geobacter sp. SVR]GCF85007.1 hypothetical protein GSbR_16070 [Geobacter sp. SVR]